MRSLLTALLTAMVASAALADDAPTLVAEIDQWQHNPAYPSAPSHAAEWRAFLSAQRTARIARLRAYAAGGEFALNDKRPGLQFVWRDGQGRLCAMADLVSDSGHDDLVDRVAREDNALQLASVKQGELLEWMLRSGLTREEIQLIQEPAVDVRSPPTEDILMASRANPRRVAWEIARKRAHLASVIERLEMDTEASLVTTLDNLGTRVQSAPVARRATPFRS